MKLKFLSLITFLLIFYFAGLSQSIQMKVSTKDGKAHFFNIGEIRKLTFALPTGITDQRISTVIKNFNLLKCYPNPFNSSTTINYSLPINGTVEIKITDLNGRIIRIIPVGNQSPGEFAQTWDGMTDSGSRAHTGIYLCMVKFNNEIQTNKIILIK